jgi:NCS2 family nucleobase:cation symporter-2
MILAGIQVITSRMLDARRIFVVGIPLIFGLSVDMVPGLYRGVPHHFQPFVSSSLALSTVLVVALNLLFRIGVTKRKMLDLTPGIDDSQKVFNFMETNGALWGARRDVMMRAAAAVNEFLESVTSLGIVKGKAQADVTFDEFSVDVEIRYEGELMEFPSGRPADAVIVAADRTAVVSLSGFFIRQYADTVMAESEGGRCLVRLHFDH